jgi:hypothetical protein
LFLDRSHLDRSHLLFTRVLSRVMGRNGSLRSKSLSYCVKKTDDSLR